MEPATRSAPHAAPVRDAERRPSEAPPYGARAALLLALGLLCLLVMLAVVLPVAGPRMSGERHRVAPPSGGYAGAPAGPMAQATEVTATPSHGEPTDVVPSPSGGSPTPAGSGTPSAGTPAPPAGQTPTPPPAGAGPLSIEITCAQAADNVFGQVCVHTTPGAALNITVAYCSGLDAHNTDLQGTRYADAQGNYTWTWVPETTCRGPAIAHVRANAAGDSADASAPFSVP